ncbi:MAG: CHAT domain-containing protein [Rhodocyclaceae bacterium]|nr:CHAT domain-containing protein [Rhodocyclaceae bacterium]
MFRNLVLSTKINPNAAVIVPAGENVEIADVEAIRGAPRLAETADELRAMAKALKSDANSLWLQQSATESTIKRLDLARYRTLAFATHGVMAGEIKGIGEPGLILTPPQQGSPEDDGYLSSSEIARLKLNADWVVLSACNTAAADGTPGAEGLSGLAKAFFYAGARSLLVSHWPVASEATVLLTTVMMKEYEANPWQWQSRGPAQGHAGADCHAGSSGIRPPDVLGTLCGGRRRRNGELATLTPSGVLMPVSSSSLPATPVPVEFAPRRTVSLHLSHTTGSPEVRPRMSSAHQDQMPTNPCIEHQVDQNRPSAVPDAG